MYAEVSDIGKSQSFSIIERRERKPINRQFIALAGGSDDEYKGSSLGERRRARTFLTTPRFALAAVEDNNRSLRFKARVKMELYGICLPSSSLKVNGKPYGYLRYQSLYVDLPPNGRADG